ncbi:MAG: hypothetical protein IT204_17695 [Fimbriimonadaceae bacterium]|nr:hypothetical protein [Fimbriimonadaceae bacterium]
MGTAYTPGLTVNGRAEVQLTRRLPLKGEVLVQVGDAVEPDTAVARTALPGEVVLLRAGDKLGVTGNELLPLLRKQVGDAVTEGEVLAETPGLLGRFFKSTLLCPATGSIETVTARTGNISIRRPPRPVVLNAFVQGRVLEVIAGEGAVIATRGALVQGIFGIGGERWGKLLPCADGHLPASAPGAVIVLPGRVDLATYQAAAAAGAIGVVGGAILDADLREILGREIGVAITGDEDVPATLILTEGFGEVPMAGRTWDLLTGLAGRAASISGATQIRAGVIRPQIIVPDASLTAEQIEITGAAAQILDVGTVIRLIREPWFGQVGQVTGLPHAPQAVESGAVVRVLTAALQNGQTVTVPRANVEIVAG